MEEHERKEADRQAWLDGLKSGDPVAISISREGTYELARVTGRKGHGIQTTDGNFGRDGWSVRRGYWPRRVVPVTDEIRESIRRRDMVGKLGNAKWDDSHLRTETLALIWSIVEAALDGKPMPDPGIAALEDLRQWLLAEAGKGISDGISDGLKSFASMVEARIASLKNG